MKRLFLVLECLISTSFAHSESAIVHEASPKGTLAARSILAQFFLQQARIPHGYHSQSLSRYLPTRERSPIAYPNAVMQVSDRKMKDAWLEMVNSLEVASEAMNKASVEAAEIAALEAKCLAGNDETCEVLAREEKTIAEVRASWDTAAKTITQVSDIISSSSSYLDSLSEEELEKVWNAKHDAANALNQFVQKEAKGKPLEKHGARSFQEYLAAKHSTTSASSSQQQGSAAPPWNHGARSFPQYLIDSSVKKATAIEQAWYKKMQDRTETKKRGGLFKHLPWR